MTGDLVSSVESVIVFIIVLSILILVHEWGHFITAKKCGIAVQRFALGFGPTLYAREYRGTLYMINAIPLGGYVKMAGDERSECTGKPGEFFSKSVGVRSLVVLNGPVVNFVLAYLSFVLVFMIGYPGQSARIAQMEAEGPAQKAGLQLGDKIVAINDGKTYGWINIEQRLEGSNPAPINVTVERNNEAITIPVIPDIKDKNNIVGRKRRVRDLGIDNVKRVIPNGVGGVLPGMPAEKAGLLAGDKIIEIDGQPIADWEALQKAIAYSSGEMITVTVDRQGQKLVKNIKPVIKSKKDEFGKNEDYRVIGIQQDQELELDLFRFGFFDALRFSVTELKFITVFTYESLFRMITGAMSAKEVTGPVGIFYIVKGAAEAGISHLLFILGVISASLAIFNLLPIFPLDGGHLFLFAIEKIRGRSLSPRADEYIARTGFSLIILLAVFVFYNDFVRYGLFDQIGNWIGQIGKLLS